MTFQAYLDNVKAKTGKTLDDFAGLAAEKGLASHGDLVKWLKDDFALGHGHATAIAGAVAKRGVPRATAGEKVDALFAGGKQHWRPCFDDLVAKIRAFGPDADAQAGGTYVNLLRDGRKFAIVQPSSADRLDLGIKLKGAPTDGRFEAAGKWNAMVSHRVRITAPSQVDAEVFSWLRRAYEAAA